MRSLKTFLRQSCAKIWEGILQNLGVLITAFILSGGYLIAINWINEFQRWVRSVPTDYVLTPFVLLIVTLVVLVRFNRKQQERISELEKEPPKDEKEAKFVTHLGVWWKIYIKSEYIEDFPYCSCCETRLKLGELSG